MMVTRIILKQLLSLLCSVFSVTRCFTICAWRIIELLPSDEAMQTLLLFVIAILLVVLVIAGPELLRWLPARFAQYRAKRLARSRRNPRGWVSQDDPER